MRGVRENVRATKKAVASTNCAVEPLGMLLYYGLHLLIIVLLSVTFLQFHFHYFSTVDRRLGKCYCNML